MENPFQIYRKEIGTSKDVKWMIKEIRLKEVRGDMPEPAGRICRREYPGAETGFSQF